MGKKAQRRRLEKNAAKMAAQAARPAPKPGAVTAVTDATFDRDVLRADGPVLVDFWAPWCGPCKTIAPVLKEIAKELEGRLRIVKIDTEANRRVPTDYGIRSIPTMMLFRNGDVIDKKVGAVPKASLASWLSAHV